MKTITASVLLCLLVQPYTQGAEADLLSSAPPQRAQGNTLREAVRVEAARVALTAPTRVWRGQSELAAKKVAERHWCRRHLVGCGALVGLGAGFLVGLVRAPEDFEPMGFALIFGGPIEAGIGAATGGIIWAYTEPERP